MSQFYPSEPHPEPHPFSERKAEVRPAVYTSLYRRWRPQLFSQVVGQEHVTRTLQNALDRGRVAHAYLFCGLRGTGKTTMAKLLAKALNCVEGVGAEPCNACRSCREINTGRNLDVMEIDAASNRGIDEIRELREKVRYTAAENRYKVYIIDEVHMLTNEAFNALLKTLEEPPSGVVFVLATTEAHKLPLTVISRCQRFEFHLLEPEQIAERLREVADDMGFEVEEEALYLLARQAEGSVRDALGFMEQCLAYGGERITHEEALGVLGLASPKVIFDLMSAVAEENTAAGLASVREVVSRGRDLHRFVRELILYLRKLLLLQAGEKEAEVLSDVPALRPYILEHRSTFDRDLLLEMLEILQELVTSMKGSSHPQFLLELCFLRLSRAYAFRQYLSPRGLLGCLEELEEKLQAAGATGLAASGLRTGERAVPPREKRREDEEAAGLEKSAEAAKKERAEAGAKAAGKAADKEMPEEPALEAGADAGTGETEVSKEDPEPAPEVDPGAAEKEAPEKEPAAGSEAGEKEPKEAEANADAEKGAEADETGRKEAGAEPLLERDTEPPVFLEYEAGPPPAPPPEESGGEREARGPQEPQESPGPGKFREPRPFPQGGPAGEAGAPDVSGAPGEAVPDFSPEAPEEPSGPRERGEHTPTTPPPAPGGPGDSAAGAGELPAAGDPELDLKEFWRGEFLPALKRRRKPGMHAILQECRPLSLEGKVLTVAFPPGYSFHKEQVETANNRKIIQSLLEELLGRSTVLRAVYREEEDVPAEIDPAGPYTDPAAGLEADLEEDSTGSEAETGDYPPAAPRGSPTPGRSSFTKEKRRGNPGNDYFIREMLELFNGRLIDDGGRGWRP